MHCIIPTLKAKVCSSMKTNSKLTMLSSRLSNSSMTDVHNVGKEKFHREICFKNRKTKKWFSVSLNFSTEKDNFEMHSVAVQEQIEESQKLFNEVTRKHEEAKRIREFGKLEEAKKIRDSVSSTDVLILAITQALRERSGGHSSVADVFEAIKDNECLATQVTMFIDNLKDEKS